MIHRPIYHLGPEKNQNCRRVLFFADKENKQQQTQRSADNRNLILCRCKVVLIRSSPISPPHRQPQNMLLAATGHLVTTNIIEKNNSAQHMFYEHSLQTSVFAHFFPFFCTQKECHFQSLCFCRVDSPQSSGFFGFFKISFSFSKSLCGHADIIVASSVLLNWQ